MRSVVVIPGNIWVEQGASSNREALPRQARRLRRGRPLYFSLQVAKNWVDAKDAEWLGKGEKRILLTEKGQQRFVEIKAILSMPGYMTSQLRGIRKLLPPATCSGPKLAASGGSGGQPPGTWRRLRAFDRTFDPAAKVPPGHRSVWIPCSRKSSTATTNKEKKQC